MTSTTSLAVPPVWAAAASRRNVDGHELLEVQARPELVDLEVEVATRELASLDVRDMDEVAAFISRTGHTHPTFSTELVGEWHELDGLARASRYLLSGDPSEWSGFVWTDEIHGTQAYEACGDPDELFALVLNQHLQELAPRVVVGPPRVEPQRAEAASLWAALAAQLANALLERAMYLRCAADDCEVDFRRQRGRARQGQHRRMGTKYCSTTCATRQAQRDRRRRLRDSENA